jgi:hypothetical protein
MDMTAKRKSTPKDGTQQARRKQAPAAVADL